MTWIPKGERPPGKDDCDKWGCILAWHTYKGAEVVHLSNFERFGGGYTHWMRTPEGPGA